MIWVIGCNGMLGTQLCKCLKDADIEYTGTDRNADITDISSLEAFVQDKKIDFIINCAAYTAVDKAESDEALARKLNSDGPRNIAKVAKKIGATLIHISTDYVFDGTGDTPRTEDMAIAPIGVYGKTKAEGEDSVKSNCDKYYVLRTAWLYGYAGKNFVYTMIKAMNTHPAVKVVCDQRGTPTWTGTLADVILRIVNKAQSLDAIPYGIYHVTDEGETTWHAFTVEIKKQALTKGWLTNPDCTVNSCTTQEYPTPAKRPAYSVLSKAKIQKALGFTLPQWQESLSKFLNDSDFDKTRLE